MPISRIDNEGLTGPIGGRRNLIINGGLTCWQRATSATTVINGKYQTADRWKLYESTDGAYTTQQSTGNAGDTGHDTALQANVTTADGTIGAAQYAAIAYNIEAQDLQHLQWGTAAGKHIILSFWVKSSKTGVYSLSTEKADSTAYRRVNEYTISSANTWEHKTILIPPLTNSNSGGTIANDSGLGIKFEWVLAYGSNFTTSSLDQWITTDHFASTNQVNWMDNTSNNFYLTGVQLEVGSVATEFEHRSFAEEFQLCERYFQYVRPAYYDGQTTNKYLGLTLSVPLRAAASATRVGNVISGSEGTTTMTFTSNSTYYLNNNAFGVGGAYNMDAEL